MKATDERIEAAAEALWKFSGDPAYGITWDECPHDLAEIERAHARAALEAVPEVEPLSNDDAESLLGEAIHTGLRKGTDAKEAHQLWTAIDGSESAWSDALAYAVWALSQSGVGLYRRSAAKASAS